jgi:hypothetical protein
MEQGDWPHTRNSLHLSYRCLKFQDISEAVSKCLSICHSIAWIITWM